MLRYISGLTIFVLAAMLSACGPSGSGEATPHTYDILISNFATPPRVQVSVDVPASWSETIGNDGTPQYKAPGISGLSLGVTAILVDQPDAAARIEKAIGFQYGNDANLVRETLPDGRVWTMSTDPRSTHARLFVPMDGGVVMGVAWIDKATDEKLAEVRSVFETIKIVAP